MFRRPPLALFCVALVFAAVAASAAPRDNAAKKKIDEAINQHYVVANFDQAEAMLLAAVSACAGQCSPNVTAKAWMYVGVVRGGGKNNQKGAKEAFVNALMADPAVPLDDALATPQTKKTFARAQREVGATPGVAPSKGGVEPGGEGEGEGGTGAVDCSLKVPEVQTRRPIPVSCTAAENAKKLELKYKVGSEGWKTLKMKKKKGAFQTTIPCAATQRAGALRYYVRAHDENGDPAGGLGKKSKPEKLSIVKQTEEEPPAFPEKDPPKRCAKSGEKEEEELASCESSDDCDGGAKCVEGKCEAPKAKKVAGKNFWLGLHFAYDFALVGGTEVCSLKSQRDSGFACFHSGTEEQYRFETHPKYANEIQTGLSPATFRILASLEYLISGSFLVGVRAGYAAGGGPPSGRDKEVAFLPYHLELRGSYWLGDAASSVRPYFGVQGGAAQVDAKLPVSVGDCAGVPGGPPSAPGATLAKDFAYYQECTQGNATPARLELDAYKKLGKGFAGAHGGVVFFLSPESGIAVDLSFKQMFPTSGQVFEPSLGYLQGL